MEKRFGTQRFCRNHTVTSKEHPRRLFNEMEKGMRRDILENGTSLNWDLEVPEMSDVNRDKGHEGIKPDGLQGNLW